MYSGVVRERLSKHEGCRVRSVFDNSSCDINIFDDDSVKGSEILLQIGIEDFNPGGVRYIRIKHRLSQCSGKA